jgi:protein ImuB
MSEVRTLVVWCPDWPVIAAELLAGAPAYAPVAVLYANRVLACSPAARVDGVRRGLRKREAQGRCPRLIVIEYDVGRDTRAFEPVLAAVEEIAPGVEVLRPGVAALAARGPARYFGGEERAAERLVEQVAQRCGVEAQIGIAEGVFAAGLAARAGRLIPPGQSAAFLAGLPIATIGRPVLVDLLRRLGIQTLGAFAALPAGDVLARFGFDAAAAHRAAAGHEEYPLTPRKAPPDLDVTEQFDEPVERVDAAAFAARRLADRLHTGLGAHGLACTRLVIEARTETGEELCRTWRHDGLLSVVAIADRVRWQLDGWLTAGRRGSVDAPTSGITRLRLAPEGLVTAVGLQPGLWGEVGEEQERASRALTRVQGLLGPEAVLTPVLGGGRTSSDRVRLVPWGDERAPARPLEQPWPGALPSPAPAIVYSDPLPAAVYDIDGALVRVTGRLGLTAAPAQVAIGRQAPVEVLGWAGPWPVDERWWSADEAKRCARFQITLVDGRALLLVLESGRWMVSAQYD